MKITSRPALPTRDRQIIDRCQTLDKLEKQKENTCDPFMIVADSRQSTACQSLSVLILQVPLSPLLTDHFRAFFISFFVKLVDDKIADQNISQKNRAFLSFPHYHHGMISFSLSRLVRTERSDLIVISVHAVVN